ncbi:MAG: hypothetical protein JSS00_02975 [Proteobacteria bacterium]|nr:hypothetical protein [Pseudomonadota bacterium]
MSAQLKIEFFAGSSIQDAAQEGIRLAKLLTMTVVFDFNEVHVMVHPDHQQIDVVAAFYEALESKSQYKIACGHAGTWERWQIAEREKQRGAIEASKKPAKRTRAAGKQGGAS